MNYVFPFEVLLNHKRKLQDEARRRFAEAQALVDQAVGELNSIYDQVDHARAENQRLELSGSATTSTLIMNNEFISGSKWRIEAQRMKIIDLKMTAEELQEAMVEAAKETKTLEKLRERGLEEFKKTRRKREMKETDELVVLRHKVGDE